MGMKCCQDADTLDDIADGRSRRCTDLLCLILFFASLGAVAALNAVAVDREPDLLNDLLYPPDSYGNNCGKPDTSTSSMPKVFYPQLDSDIQSQIATVASGMWWNFKPTKMCATACPSGFSLKTPVYYGGDSYPGGSKPPGTWYTFDTQDVVNRCFPRDTSGDNIDTELCSVPSCTNQTLNATLGGTLACTIVPAQPEADNVWEICASGTSSSLCATQQAACELRVKQQRVDTFVPTAQTSSSEEYTREFASYVQMVIGAFDSLLVEDGYGTVLIVGVVLPVAFGLSWCALMYILAGTFVILAIILLFVIEIVLCFWLAYQAGWFEGTGIDLTAIYNASLTSTADDDMKGWYSFFAVVAIIFTVWHLIAMFLARKAVFRLIAILRETTKVYKQMSAILFWPLFSVLLQGVVFVLGIFMFYFMVYAFIGKEDLEDYVGGALCAAHVLFFLWWLQVIKGSFWASMSGAVAIWYVKDSAKSGFCTFGGGGSRLCRCTGMIFSKHLGSICFGALIISIFKAIRWAFSLLEYAAEDQLGSNIVLKIIFKCVHCCLWCIEKTVEYISYWGFIFVAVKGTSFCRSCFDAFAFQVKYFSQALVNKSVVVILKLMMKVSITVTCTLIAFLYLDGQSSFKEKYNPLWCSLVVLMTSYIIANCFTMVLDVSIDTIYLCSFEDMERCKANKDATPYMSEGLRKAFGIDVADDEAGPAGKAAGEKAKKRTGKVEPSESTSSS